MTINVDAQLSEALCGGSGHERKPSLTFEDAVAKAVAAALPLITSEAVPLAQSFGRVIAQDVFARECLPRFDHAAMDGFAVRTEDFIGNGPWNLRDLGTIAAGDLPFSGVPSTGTAIQIFTGAPVPAEFDAVVMRERCVSLGGSQILLSSKPRVGENIRRRGEDIARGTRVAQKGAVMTAHQGAAFAGLGMSVISVRPRIRIAFLTTGSELRRPGEPLHDGQIYDSNSVMAAGMLAQPWIEYTDLGRIPDDLNTTIDAVDRASHDYDVLISSGGMSFGAADQMRTALEAVGAKLDVLNVAMRPGKPATFGRVGRALFIGLPGNPMAAAVALRQIALAAIKRTAGFAVLENRKVAAVSGFEYTKREGRTEFVPVRVVGHDRYGRPQLDVLGRGSSGSLLPLAQASGLVKLDANLSYISAGDSINFEPF
ncbi:MAG: molybdopterin molybdotransferase MoeA [Pseudorhizobium sp.]